MLRRGARARTPTSWPTSSTSGTRAAGVVPHRDHRRRSCACKDPETGEPLVDQVLDKAGQKGTGKWTAQVALDLGVPIPTIAAAIDARVLSTMKDERVAASKRARRAGRKPASADREQLIERRARRALRGEDLLVRAGHGAHPGRLARVEVERSTCARWRASGRAAASSARASSTRSCARTSGEPTCRTCCSTRLRGARRRSRQPALAARSSARAQSTASPVPAMSASLAYFDGYRTRRAAAEPDAGAARRFGAHTYQRNDDADAPFVHTDWLNVTRRRRRARRAAITSVVIRRPARAPRSRRGRRAARRRRPGRRRARRRRASTSPRGHMPATTAKRPRFADHQRARGLAGERCGGEQRGERERGGRARRRARSVRLPMTTKKTGARNSPTAASMRQRAHAGGAEDVVRRLGQDETGGERADDRRQAEAIGCEAASKQQLRLTAKSAPGPRRRDMRARRRRGSASARSTDAPTRNSALCRRRGIAPADGGDRRRRRDDGLRDGEHGEPSTSSRTAAPGSCVRRRSSMLAEIASTAPYADAGGGDGGAEEERAQDVRQRGAPAKPSAVDARTPTTATAGGGARRGYLAGIVEAEADLEEQHDEAQRAPDRSTPPSRGQRPERVHADERQVAEHDAGDELTQHRRLTRAHRQLAAKLGGGEDERRATGGAARSDRAPRGDDTLALPAHQRQLGREAGAERGQQAVRARRRRLAAQHLVEDEEHRRRREIAVVAQHVPRRLGHAGEPEIGVEILEDAAPARMERAEREVVDGDAVFGAQRLDQRTHAALERVRHVAVEHDVEAAVFELEAHEVLRLGIEVAHRIDQRRPGAAAAGRALAAHDARRRRRRRRLTRRRGWSSTDLLLECQRRQLDRHDEHACARGRRARARARATARRRRRRSRAR